MKLRPTICLLLNMLLFACTAESQVGDFLRRNEPGPTNVVFSENFENGLGQWSQVSGSWTTGTPAISGVALISPATTSATPHYLTTLNNIDLTGLTNCELTYDARFSFSATSGVGAQILYAGTAVAEFRDTSASAAISSSGLFVTRKARLDTSTKGKLAIWVAVPSGSADLRLDNISIACNQAPVTAVTVMYENLNASAANWTLSSWSWVGSGGLAGSGALQKAYTNASAGFTASGWASLQPVQSLANRQGCKLDFYYSVNATGASECLYLEINASKIWTLCNTVAAGNTTRLLTAFEGMSSLTFTLRGDDPDTTFGAAFGGTVDELKLTCEQ